MMNCVYVCAASLPASRDTTLYFTDAELEELKGTALYGRRERSSWCMWWESDHSRCAGR